MVCGSEWTLLGGPYGVRTRVSGLRGQHPGLLGEWAVSKMTRIPDAGSRDGWRYLQELRPSGLRRGPISVPFSLFLVSHPTLCSGTAHLGDNTQCCTVLAHSVSNALRQYQDAARPAGATPVVSAGRKTHANSSACGGAGYFASSKRTAVTLIYRYGSITLCTSMMGVGMPCREPLHQSRPAYSPPLMTVYDTWYQVG